MRKSAFIMRKRLEYIIKRKKERVKNQWLSYFSLLHIFGLGTLQSALAFVENYYGLLRSQLFLFTLL